MTSDPTSSHNPFGSVTLAGPPPKSDQMVAAEAMRSGDFTTAMAAAERLLKSKPGNVEALALLGIASLGMNKLNDAETWLRQALVKSPNHPDVWCNLGVVLGRKGQFDKAVEAYQHALRISPNHAESWANLGTMLLDSRRLEEATGCLSRAVQAMPNRADLIRELARNLLAGGRVPDAMACFQRSVQLVPADPRPRMAILMGLNYLPDVSPEQVFDEHKAFGEWFQAAAAGPAPTFTNERSAEKKLRIGLVSPDFRAHSCASFISAVLQHAASDRAEFWCYSQAPATDPTAQRFQQLAAGWRSTSGLKGDQIAELARTDGIDILIDLAGHTYGGRLDAFIHRGAPVQMTYLGYPNTTGLSSMDWRIVDGVTDPVGADAFATERLARLDDCFLCFDPPEPMKLAPVAARQSGPMTFGAVTNLAKITPAVIGAWGEILKRSPGSRMLLKSPWLDDEPTWARFAAAFKAAGAPEGSVARMPYAPSLNDHLAGYSEIDLILDTWPYNGTTTTCEQLWMGVPVLTLRGETHASRVGASLLTAIGLHDHIAATEQDYIAKAADLASRPGDLRALRAGLRERTKASPLMDGPAFGRKFESALREAWRDWCKTSTQA